MTTFIPFSEAAQATYASVAASTLVTPALPSRPIAATAASAAAAAAAADKPLSAPRPPPAPATFLPDHFGSNLTVLIDVRAALPSSSKEDRLQLLLSDLAVPPAAVAAFYILHVTQELLVSFRDEAVYSSVLASLQAGTPWAAAGGRTVFGRPAAAPCLQLRVTNVPPWVPVAAITAGLERYGRVLRAVRGRLPGLPAASDGVLHIQLQPSQGVELPSFLALTVGDHPLAEVFPIFTDDYSPRCFKCGGRHSGLSCRLAARPLHQQGSVWGRLVLPAPPPQPTKLPSSSPVPPTEAKVEPQMEPKAAPPSPGGRGRRRRRKSSTTFRASKRGRASSLPGSVTYTKLVMTPTSINPSPSSTASTTPVLYSFTPSGRLCRDTDTGPPSNMDYSPYLLDRYINKFSVTDKLEILFKDPDAVPRSRSPYHRHHARLQQQAAAAAAAEAAQAAQSRPPDTTSQPQDT